MKFNLLLPDPYSPSAYAVIQCLKEFCDKIYVCVYSGSFFSKLSCPASYSRYVNEVFFVENPSGDWGRSFYCKDNTEKEERFLTQILAICKRKSINLIYPTNDPSVYLFSKNIQRFKDSGIEVPVPEYSKFLFMMDKLTITSLAEKSGVACPKTNLLKEDSFDKIISELEFPVIIKPRFGMGSSGIRKCADAKELFTRYKSCIAKSNEMLVQEYIPSTKMIMMNVYMDKDSDPVANLCYRLQRPDRRIFYVRMGAHELIEPHKNLGEIIGLLKSLKFQGFTNVQFRVDSRNETPKLLEMNIKMSGSIWMDMRLGISRPLFNYYIYTGKDFTPFEYQYRKGVFFLSPVEDGMIFLVYLFCWFMKYILKYCFFCRNNPLDNLPTIKEMVNDYKSKYLRKDNEFNLYCTNFFKDPLVSFSAWVLYFYKLIKEDFPDSFVQ